MKTTTYICDSCKRSVSKDDLVEMKLEVKNIYFNEANSFNRSQSTIDICKDCLKKKGFVIETITKDNKEEIENKNNNTLKAKILDVFSELDISFFEG